MLKKGTTVYTVFSEYTIDQQIGQGGNGTVFLVHDSNNEKFALKAIDRNKEKGEKLKRFKNEIAFCENNIDPHIIKVLDHGTYTDNNNNIIFYIMPVYKHTLREIMNDGIAADKVLPLVTQILSGLRFAHEKGVWHRDIKPENILIDENGNAVLADFGIAHFSSDDLATIVETKQSDRLANFQYAAPEQRVRNGVIDGHADIYALGLIINEMFTNALPIGTDYRKIGDTNTNYAWLDTVVDFMLKQLPNERLYPASTVATRILAAQKDWNLSRELLSIAEERINTQGPYQMKTPVIRDYEYDKGELKIYLSGIDYYWFETWFSILQSAEYNHGEVLGYGPHRLRHYPPECIAMPISSSNETNKQVAKYIKQWLEESTKVFNKKQNDKYIRAENERRQKKEEEIQRLRHEVKMKEAIKGLFD